MIHINPTNKFFILFYILLVIIIMSVLVIIIYNFIVANSTNPVSIQTHTTQLNLQDFNLILKQIKK